MGDAQQPAPADPDAPRILLSDTKLSRTAKHTVELVLGRRWRETRGLSRADVRSAGISSRVLLPSLLDATCEKCSPAFVVGGAFYVPAADDSETERYCFELRSRCNRPPPQR
eukprot:m51a1_g7740 hypothetical protein (112) ;mRNA; r:876-1558